jgi:hypothetical protein
LNCSANSFHLPFSFWIFFSKTHSRGCFGSGGARAKPASPGRRALCAADPCGGDSASGKCSVSHRCQLGSRIPRIAVAKSEWGVRVRACQGIGCSNRSPFRSNCRYSPSVRRSRAFDRK